jgi:hypothetical protein
MTMEHQTTYEMLKNISDFVDFLKSAAWIYAACLAVYGLIHLYSWWEEWQDESSDRKEEKAKNKARELREREERNRARTEEKAASKQRLKEILEEDECVWQRIKGIRNG